jgi:plasmid stabilization system protein ParE
MRSVALTPRAERDLLRLMRFLGAKNPRAARAAFGALQNGLRSLEEFPERGRQARRPNHRELHVTYGRDGYVVLYRVDQQSVLVARIFHAREER